VVSDAALLRSLAGRISYCTDADRETLMLLADDARLDDRQTLVRLMTMGNPRVSSGCRLCIAATLANVFGGDALKEQLHIVTDMGVSPPLPSACLATLGQQLAATQAGKLKTLLENGVPISLSFGAALAAPGGQRLVISDVYVAAADGSTVSSAPVYTGLGTGSHLFRCDPDKYPRLWAVFAASDLADAGEGSGIATAIHTKSMEAVRRLDPDRHGNRPGTCRRFDATRRQFAGDV
jgi:hypothetical protein